MILTILQVLASRECLNESDDGSEYEEKNLMSKVRNSCRNPKIIFPHTHRNFGNFRIICEYSQKF